VSLTLLSGTANPALAEAVARELDLPLAAREVERFPDGEMHVEVRASVRGCDVYLLQPTGPPVEEHVLQLLLLGDACRRAGAARVTAIMPYMGYARQDRRTTGREPVGARVVADVLAVCGLQRIVAVDLHSSALEGMFTLPLEHLTAVPLLAARLHRGLPEDGVVVAPDLGAAKLADRYARQLGLPVALVHKRRVSGAEVTVRGVTGEVRNRVPLVVDDMITTGATIEAAIQALLEAGCRPEITVAATHGLFVGDALQRLARLPIRRLLTTDSVRAPESKAFDMECVSLAPLLADAISRLHGNRSLSELIVHG
jgi:ribose-phosphate pyrophosphokinase